jgi:hypothetical protein
MKELAALTVLNLPSLVCLWFSGALAMRELGGWGWFLVVGCLLACTTTGLSKSKPSNGSGE